MNTKTWLRCRSPLWMFNVLMRRYQYLDARQRDFSNSPSVQECYGLRWLERKLRLWICACWRQTELFHMPTPWVSATDFARAITLTERGCAGAEEEAMILSGLRDSVYESALRLVQQAQYNTNASVAFFDHGRQALTQTHFFREIFGVPYRWRQAGLCAVCQATGQRYNCLCWTDCQRCQGTGVTLSAKRPLSRRVAGDILERQAWGELPVLADALEDEGVSTPDLLNHLRQGEKHLPGCWALDAVLAGTRGPS